MTLYWLLLAAAIATAILGQLALKAGAGAENFIAQLFDRHSMIGLVLYGGAALLYMIALRRIPVSVALPCTAASYIVITLVGHFVFGEPLGLQQIAAIGLICAGVVMLAMA